MKRLDQLAVTRIFVVMLVVMYHGYGGVYLSAFNNPPLGALFRPLAPIGVCFLFVLSGFVMSLVYHRPAKTFDFFGYWRTRVIRVYPLYWLSLALTFLYYIDGAFNIKFQKILAHILLVQGWFPGYAQAFNYPSWSLTAELFFYALFPFITVWAYKRSTRALIWSSLLLWAISQTIYQILWIGYINEYERFITYSPIFHLNSFFMGVVAGVWYLREGEKPADQKTVRRLFLLSLALVCGYGIASYYITSIPRVMQPLGGFLNPLLTVFLVTFAMDRSALAERLSHPWIAALGEASYGIYILHAPLAWIAERILQASGSPYAQTVFDLAYVPFLVGLGLFIHYKVDAPFREWLRLKLAGTSLRLVLLDVIFASLSIYLIFTLRFPEPKQFALYKQTALILFWCSFFMRPLLNHFLGNASPNYVNGASYTAIAKKALLTAAAGSAAQALLLFALYKSGTILNYPISLLALDWALLSAATVALRALFKWRNVYRLVPAPQHAAV